MQQFLNNLRLIVKLNITTAVSAAVIIITTIMFYILTNLYFNIIYKNNSSKEEVQSASNSIINILYQIDYITINNAINKTDNYMQESQKLFTLLSTKLLVVQESNYLDKDKQSISIIQNIITRVQGYKVIANSLYEELQEDNVDGLYAIMGLSSASQKILQELAVLNQKINFISKQNLKVLNQKIFYIKLFSILFITMLFFFFIYINKLILSSILYRIEKLKEEILSFFDILSKQRDDPLHITHNGADEISDIAKIIDDHIYIATDILKQEREQAKIIEEKVKEATKELTELNNEIEATQREIVFTIGSIIEEHSKETSNHVKRVAEYSLILARLHGMSLEESLLIKNASPMHDIGKVAIPDAILNKEGELTAEEFDLMKEHAEIGHKMLKHSNRSILKAASILAHEHHEQWNGEGYPQKLKGEQIHIYGRITAIVDVFDALASNRVYKKAWPIKKILAYFKEDRGTRFDPSLVTLLLENLEHFLAAKEMIENEDEDSTQLSKYIENFNRVPMYITN